jgi:hypothetical protein
MPFVIGATMTNEKSKTTDVHLKSIHYRRSYLANFMLKQDRRYINRITGEVYETEQACLDSLFNNHKVLIEGIYPALNLH